MSSFPPNRSAGLERLAQFLPRSGSLYASTRNFDLGPDDRANVSTLSPYLRHRLILEEEVIRDVLSQQSFNGASKFIQEVCWRTYWKGWLETRPQVWDAYRAHVAELRGQLEGNSRLRTSYESAISARTGIDCFDAWVRELVARGYVHNHARMWFASIWIFTLGLPWELGADFFFRHLYDGDPASNTLSWRWVGGLHTKGKTYLARPANICAYTKGRFDPSASELASKAMALNEDQSFGRTPIAAAARIDAPLDVVLLVTEEDCCPETLPLGLARVKAVAALDSAALYEDHAAHVLSFKREAIRDAAARAASYFGCSNHPVQLEGLSDQLRILRANGNADATVTAFIPVGLLRDAVAASNIAGSLLEVRREWDEMLWPHAGTGFFKLRDKIPSVVSKLGLV